ncbi:STAS domain-containing protein [Streptomyces chartreusis]|uniref:STAS domain-containing protein n=1 Tax=Streptomyces chartreusis TaxID=1969 RepID=UPI0033FC91E9
MGHKRVQKTDLRLRVSSVRAKDRVTVPVVGEVDSATLPRLRAELDTAVASGAPSIEVDFRRVEFCDCSGLTALLDARARALRAGSYFCVRGPVAPVVARLFQLTKTGPSLLKRAA